ncbi:hypothetical protein [Thioalkalivibrio sp. ALMg11]|uniref:hypothetical protein n=1 Tax=Thioalkalivibrio sp. ALMg11 TaxID=1158165 RepID=UPI000364D232|nr:hypothetical protein [Thioalkalivibrio sp. ALMg11]
MAFDRQQWLDRLLLSSIPLRKIDGNGNPVGIASGCLIDYLGVRIILSVFHATKRDGNWAIEVGYEAGKGTQLYKPGGFHHLGKMKLGDTEIAEVDFSYREVAGDLLSYFQEIVPPGAIKRQALREVFQPDFDIAPGAEEMYGFAGQVLPEFHEPSSLVTEMRVYPGLKYVGTEGDYHVFELPVPHPGHEHFQGCSGAPILDTQGNPVALVCSGDTDRNVILGISLKQ